MFGWSMTCGSREDGVTGARPVGLEVIAATFEGTGLFGVGKQRRQ